MTLKRKILYGILAAVVLIQFIRPERNSGTAESPDDIAHFTAVPPEVNKILITSCNDCHSDHTEYPWYTNVQPVGWWLNYHVEEGKDELNFSQFNTYRVKRKLHKLDEIVEMVEEKEMPLNSYLWIHGDAKLDAAQTKLVIDWATENKNRLAELYPDSLKR